MTHIVAVAMLLAWAAERVRWEALLYIGAVAFPEMTACVLPVLVVRGLRSSKRGHSAEVLMLVRLASELRAGATLRAAIVHVADVDESLDRAAALARAGRPMSVVIDVAAPALGRFGAIAGAALRMSSTTGGSLAPVVEQLVVQVMALDDLDRERRAAMAPALLQAAVVGGVPLVTLIAMGLSGRLVELAAQGPWHTGMVVTGALLVLGGSALVARLSLRRGSW